ncbi:sigma-70 family RNA polymerase sigma factor [Plantactinospora sp. S1510]|uniref:Sigma-70 family RNA polymerase sigma factor n=1 Tax=Plantactinospora alkalitolerans TaxID=2789879 RepID=A0ABS0H7K0_9ACTN|nr:sigma-70 family RNA polymerase sigma factor [Plantactinospora alkalitolerans]MBF9134124.1 sigma-70 family RNA polymerase sigma factor [Plantactinospora alkalitolerans]
MTAGPVGDVTGGNVGAMRSELVPRLEVFRGELTGYCYRMLGSAFDAEDAVQEAMVRAWRNLDRYDEDRGTLRSWLYTIATNICLDMLRGAGRRARAVDLGPSWSAGPSLGPPLPESAWVQPIPDHRILAAGADPAEVAVRRESIRLAFVAALQHLPPRQRAVLILRDVLCWTAEEVARLLDTTATSVSSALQRARSTLRGTGMISAGPIRQMDEAQRALLVRYCDAFERYDVENLVALLHEDATMSMPPFAWWLRGRAEIRRAILGSGGACADARLVPTSANGSPAFGQYRRSGPDGGYQPFALVVVETSGELISGITTFLDPERLFPLFELPMTLEAETRI